MTAGMPQIKFYFSLLLECRTFSADLLIHTQTTSPKGSIDEYTYLLKKEKAINHTVFLKWQFDYQQITF